MFETSVRLPMPSADRGEQLASNGWYGLLEAYQAYDALVAGHDRDWIWQRASGS